MTDSINEAIASRSAHELASAGGTTRSGWLHSDAACHIDGYGTVFATSSGWQVRDLYGCEDRIDNDELAEELAEIITMTKQIL